MIRTGVRSDPPRYLRTVSWEELDVQSARWSLRGSWRDLLAQHPGIVEELDVETADHGGSIRREFVHSFSQRDPVELFLVVMAWGFGSTPVRWPGQRAILSHPPRREIEGIVHAVQNGGALAGWGTLFGAHRIGGFSYAFGTKLLYFAGYRTRCPGPRPLILDAFVLSALHDAGTGILAGRDVVTADYLRYLEVAEDWAQDPSWPDGTPELVEYGLFERGRELSQIVANRRRNFRTPA